MKYAERDMKGHPRYEKLQQRVEVDPVEEYEKIEVPNFGPTRPAIFVHDFHEVIITKKAIFSWAKPKLSLSHSCMF